MPTGPRQKYQRAWRRRQSITRSPPVPRAEQDALRPGPDGGALLLAEEVPGDQGVDTAAVRARESTGTRSRGRLPRRFGSGVQSPCLRPRPDRGEARCAEAGATVIRSRFHRDIIRRLAGSRGYPAWAVPGEPRAWRHGQASVQVSPRVAARSRGQPVPSGRSGGSSPGCVVSPRSRGRGL